MDETQDNWYCPAPFKHVFIDATGVSPCCMIKRQQVSLSEWRQNPQLIEIQQNLSRGNVPKECKSCYHTEMQGIISLRHGHLRDYNHEKFDSLDIDFIDYRYSNLCNFKCRSCFPRFSHKIAQETQNHPTLLRFLPGETTEKFISVHGQNVEWILNNLSKIKRLMFTGGEPTVIPEIRLLIERILSDPENQTKILITTNGSFSDRFWYDLIDKLPDRLHWTLSIDAIGVAAEIIRHGTKWDVIEKNWRWLSKNAESLDVNTTVTNLSMMQLKPLLIMCRELQRQSIAPKGRHGSEGFRHQINLADQQHISPLNWPDGSKLKVLEHLDQCLELDLDETQRTILEGIRSAIKSYKFSPEQWKKSEEYRIKLDQIRNEDSLGLLP